MNFYKQQCLFSKTTTIINKTICNSFARWTARKPHRIISVDQYEHKNDSQQKVDWREMPTNNAAEECPNVSAVAKVEMRVKPFRSRMKSYESIKKLSKQSTDMLQVVFDENNDFIYTKMADTDPRVSILLTNVKSRKDRKKQDLILLEGKRLIIDALECDCLLKYILFSRKSDLESLRDKLPKSGACLYKMPYTELQMWSDLSTTPGIMGLFRTPNVEQYHPSNFQLPITFILDNIREPGNLGAILRVCAGVSCSRVILTKGCAHVWEPKVTRSAMGAHFRLRMHRNVEYDQIDETVHKHLRKDKRVKVILADTTNTGTEEIPILPIIPYYSQQYDLKEEIVIIIGGETEGISDESYQFAKNHNGTCLNIPLSNNTDSLNSGAALAVIAFEVKKQLTILHNLST